MSGINANSQSINSTSLNRNIKEVLRGNVRENTNSPDVKNENNTVLKSLENLDVSNSKEGSAVSNLNILTETNSTNLPPVNVRKDGNFEFASNTYGRTMTTLTQSEKSKTTTTTSENGLAIILKQNTDKRDVLVFSNMSDKIPNNSSIPNHYFYIEGKGSSSMSFDENHNIVIQLKNKEKIVIDGKDGQTFLQGDFNIKYDPNARGKTFNINHTGKDHLQSFKSLGDKINW